MASAEAVSPKVSTKTPGTSFLVSTVEGALFSVWEYRHDTYNYITTTTEGSSLETGTASNGGSEGAGNDFGGREDMSNGSWPGDGGNTSYEPDEGWPGIGGGDFGFNIDITWPVWLTVISSVCLIVSFVSNLWILYAGLRQRVIRNSPFHLILMNHTLTNLLLSCLIYPYMAFKANTGFLRNRWEEKLCHFAYMCMFWWVGVALLTNGAVAINRALSCFPHQVVGQALQGRQITCITIILIWLFSAVIYITPPLTYYTAFTTQMTCLPVLEYLAHLNDDDVALLHNILKNTCGLNVLLVLIVSTTSYSIIIWHLFCRKCCPITYYTGSGATTRHGYLPAVTHMSAQRRRERMRALCIIVSAFLVFMVCWLPLVYAILYKPEYMVLKPIIAALPIWETALNPLLYLVSMPIFRPRWCIQKKFVTPKLSNAHTTHSKGGIRISPM